MEKIPQLSESLERLRLRALEQEGIWLFHGSGAAAIETFEPKQALTAKKSNLTEMLPDDKPAVFATPLADIAIFMAVVRPKNTKSKGNYYSGFEGTAEKEEDVPEMSYWATKELMDELHDVKGYVYVFRKEKFTPRSGMESLTYESVQPDAVIEVTERDLPKNIEIREI